MSEIEVGDFVRLKQGYIGTVENINDFREPSMKYAVDIQKRDLVFIGDNDIVKHSKQLIDLIECGDYVNGELITDKWVTRISSIRSNFSEEDIKTILTKESYMANCYKIGGEDEKI